jgi:hypothetical protein
MQTNFLAKTVSQPVRGPRTEKYENLRASTSLVILHYSISIRNHSGTTPRIAF